MSSQQQQQSPAPRKPDGRVFASYPMPPKIDLINERPRRESLIERQLDNSISSSGSFLPSIPEIKVSTQQEELAAESRYPHETSSSGANYLTKTTTTTTNTSATRQTDQLSDSAARQRDIAGSQTPERHSPLYKVSGVEFGYRSPTQSASQSQMDNSTRNTEAQHDQQQKHHHHHQQQQQHQTTQIIRQVSPQPHPANQYGCHEHRIIISVGPICSRQPVASTFSQQVEYIDEHQETSVQRRREQQEREDREEWLRAQQMLKEEQEILERQTREQKLRLERDREVQRQREEQERLRQQELLIEQQRQRQKEIEEQQVQRQMQQQQQQQQNSSQKVTTTTQTTITKTTNAETRATELAAKEAKLRAEIAALHDRPYSPFQVPNKIDLSNEQRSAQEQQSHTPSPRPYSRASSTRSTTTDLLIKEAQLQREIEEIEKKPFNPQKMVVEREQWFEYPQDQPNDKRLTDSKRRIKDFCSLPSHLYPTEGKHIHEENIPAPSSSAATNLTASNSSSIHTAIIKGPKREIDNKSPLPFAFDNFSTKGVRGNIASACAIEPERPRPPIYPIVKRSPSPNVARS